MNMKLFDAARAYGAVVAQSSGAAGAIGTPVGGAAGTASGAASAVAPGSAPGGFASMVEQIADQATEALAGSEAVSAKAVAGKADLVDVVTAVSNAEMVLETVTTVRDRVIQAYQDIMRMPI